MILGVKVFRGESRIRVRFQKDLGVCDFVEVLSFSVTVVRGGWIEGWGHRNGVWEASLGGGAVQRYPMDYGGSQGAAVWADGLACPDSSLHPSPGAPQQRGGDVS
jgi:hypothetical protein